jgi:hypothetical protein
MKNEYLTKTKVNYSIDKSIVEKFGKLAKQKSVNKSLLIENYLKEWIKKNELC